MLFEEKFIVIIEMSFLNLDETKTFDDQRYKLRLVAIDANEISK
jgi:hypothetical protein